jgi:23S rRNA (cytosine1962-C5)-methyltransferase
MARVTARGAERWTRGHPWIYRSDVALAPDLAGLVPVFDPRDRFLGQALFSPRSEIQLRLLERTERTVDAGWWRERLSACLARRDGIDANAYRVVHAEGDGLPSLIIDRYDRWVVAQLLSAGLETMRGDIIAAIVDVYNLPNLGNEVTEYVVTGPAFRTPTTLQPPRTAVLGARITF